MSLDLLNYTIFFAYIAIDYFYKNFSTILAISPKEAKPIDIFTLNQ